jgi:hypothetical protein
MGLWLVWLVLTHHHLHWQQLPLFQTPRERVSWLLFRLSLCLFSVRFFGCQELWSDNSHLSAIRECSPRLLPPFTRTSLPPVYHKNHLISVDSSLMVTWASLRLLASNNKDQPPLPDHLKKRLIWVDLIKMISLSFVQHIPWVPSRIPQLIQATLALWLKMKICEKSIQGNEEKRLLYQ